MACTKEDIKEKLLTDDRWLIRGAVAIYNQQTVQEQRGAVTLEGNGVGFNGCDAKFCTSVVQQYQSRGFLTANQKLALRRCMPKYCGQLAWIANGGN